MVISSPLMRFFVGDARCDLFWIANGIQKGAFQKRGDVIGGFNVRPSFRKNQRVSVVGLEGVCDTMTMMVSSFVQPTNDFIIRSRWRDAYIHTLLTKLSPSSAKLLST